MRHEGPDSNRTPIVRLRGLTKTFGRSVAVHPLDLDIHSGDFLAILGPSGCGKTTLLRMIGGFADPSGGSIEIDGRDVTRHGPERRPTNMVFQSYGLFPHMTVRQNIAYGLRIAGIGGAEIEQRVREVIALVRLEDLAERMPEGLSGGQAQRVALSRALVMRPRVLLLDEPLSALDQKLRKAMQEELRAIHRSIGGTFVYVTHDQGEALGLANRIAVMRDGRVEQEGDARDIYVRPRTRFVADFIGEANLLPGERRGGQVTLDGGGAFPDPGRDARVAVMVRPELVRLAAGGPGMLTLAGTLSDIVFLGSHTRYRVTLSSGIDVTINAPAHEAPVEAALGAPVQLCWPTRDHRVMDER